MGFGFRVRFRTAGDLEVGELLDDEDRFKFRSSTGHDYSLSFRRSTATRRGRVYVTGRGFAAEDDARLGGEIAVSSIRRAAISQRLAVDLGVEAAGGGLSTHAKEAIEAEHDVQILNDRDGIVVFNDDGRQVMTVGMEADARVSRDARPFLGELAGFIEEGQVLESKVALAADVAAFASFQSSMRARFLNLVTALEALAERRERDREGVEHVSAILSFLRERLKVARDSEDDEAVSEALDLLSAIGMLKEQSITSAMKGLVRGVDDGSRQWAGMDAEDFVAKCYSVRSKLVHDGRLGEGDELSELLSDLHDLVWTVLGRATLTSGGGGPD